jgi:hypothetical protein
MFFLKPNGMKHIILVALFIDFLETCENTYGISPNYDWALDFYGG